jgi:hypothetical protein
VKGCEFFGVRKVQHMDDQGILGRPTFGAKDGAAGSGIKGVSR